MWSHMTEAGHAKGDTPWHYWIYSDTKGYLKVGVGGLEPSTSAL